MPCAARAFARLPSSIPPRLSLVPTEAELVARAVGGDSRAFGEIARRHRPQMLRVARRRTFGRDYAEAEDIVQSALLNAFRGIKGFRIGMQVGAWLCAIVANECFQRSQSRQAGKRVRITDGVDMILMSEKGPNAFDMLARKELRAVLTEAIGELTPNMRNAVVARDVEEDRRDGDVSAVRVSACHGRRKLRKSLGTRGFGPT